MDYFLLKSTFCDHIKTKRLIKVLGPAGAWSLICLFCYTAAHHPDGNLNGNKNAIAEMANWDGDPEIFVNTLISVGFLDEENGKYKIHDWEIHNSYLSNYEKRKQAARENALKRWNKSNDLTQKPENATASETMPSHNAQNNQPKISHSENSNPEKPTKKKPKKSSKSDNLCHGIENNATALKTNATASESMPPHKKECDGTEKHANRKKGSKGIERKEGKLSHPSISKISHPHLQDSKQAIVNETQNWANEPEDDDRFLNEWKKYFDFIPLKKDRHKSFTILKVILEKRVNPVNIRNIKAYLDKMQSPVPEIKDLCPTCLNKGTINRAYCQCVTGKLFMWTFNGKPQPCHQCKDTEGFILKEGNTWTYCSCDYGKWKAKGVT